ncbi:hypothetical protein FACS1894132_11560 [Clostridia bacterium]|nr:hypothetical protein FACS1894132_11560 [Clostridia bacterium]
MLKDKVFNFFGGIVDGVKGLLGIHSPSTVFAGIGDNMALGLGEGFEKSMKNVEKDIQSAVPTDFDIQANVNSAVSMVGNMTVPSQSGGLTLAITNFYNNRAQDIEQLAYELEFYRQRVNFATGRA